MTHEPRIVSNGRQRLYLLAIFKVDQELESEARSEATCFGLDRLKDRAVEAPCGQVDEDTNARSRVDHRPCAVENGPVHLIALPNAPTVALLV